METNPLYLKTEPQPNRPDLMNVRWVERKPSGDSIIAIMVYDKSNAHRIQQDFESVQAMDAEQRKAAILKCRYEMVIQPIPHPNPQLLVSDVGSVPPSDALVQPPPATAVSEALNVDFWLS